LVDVQRNNVALCERRLGRYTRLIDNLYLELEKCKQKYGKIFHEEEQTASENGDWVKYYHVRMRCGAILDGLQKAIDFSTQERDRLDEKYEREFASWFWGRHASMMYRMERRAIRILMVSISTMAVLFCIGLISWDTYSISIPAFICALIACVPILYVTWIGQKMDSRWKIGG